MKLILATQNPKKVEEIKAKLTDFEVESLDAKVFTEDLLETGETLQENALQKARQVYTKTGCNCIADDTGLEVNCLNGEPGVYSARYAGSQKNSEDNMNLLLTKLSEANDRSAQFRTVIALIWEGKEYLFEGICKGEITRVKVGEKGFGYDPIFKPVGYELTFAEMSMETKSKISHRGLAIDKLVAFVKAETTS